MNRSLTMKGESIQYNVAHLIIIIRQIYIHAFTMAGRAVKWVVSARDGRECRLKAITKIAQITNSALLITLGTPDTIQYAHTAHIHTTHTNTYSVQRTDEVNWPK